MTAENTINIPRIKLTSQYFEHIRDYGTSPLNTDVNGEVCVPFISLIDIERAIKKSFVDANINLSVIDLESTVRSAMQRYDPIISPLLRLIAWPILNGAIVHSQVEVGVYGEFIPNVFMASDPRLLDFVPNISEDLKSVLSEIRSSFRTGGFTNPVFSPGFSPANASYQGPFGLSEEKALAILGGIMGKPVDLVFTEIMSSNYTTLIDRSDELRFIMPLFTNSPYPRVCAFFGAFVSLMNNSRNFTASFTGDRTRS